MNSKFKASVLFLTVAGVFSCLVACTGQFQDPSTLSTQRAIGEFFESWDPDTITAPGANLITFTGGDRETTFPYYARTKTYPIKFKVNTGGLPAGVIDPGIYSAKLEFTDNNGISWTQITGAENIPVTAGTINSFNWTLPITLVEGTQYLIRLTAQAVSGQSTLAFSSQNFIIDATSPSITSFSLTAGALGVANSTTINRSFFGFSVAASDVLTPLKFYCLKTDGSVIPPVETDDCWQNLGSGDTNTVSLTNQSGFIGFISGAYQLRIWVQDAATNISTLTAGTGTLGVDRLDVAYNPAVAPEITNVIISNVNSLSLTPTNSELIFAAGQTVYVRWKAVDSDLTATPISITTTTDEKNFIPVASLQNITNASQGGCGVDVNYTGCATFTAPTAGYFRVQVGALDQTGLISKGGSIAANMGQFSLLAGNTDVGLGGSANKALFLNSTKNNAYLPDLGILTVTKKGKVFYLDTLRGILVVDPADGAQKVYIPKSTTSTGDGANYSSATTANTVKISLDYQDRLLILETNRIRRVDTDGTISTIIGGGATAYDNFTKAAIKADEFQMNISDNGWILFQPLPNGNIWFGLTAGGVFNNDNGILFGVYKASDNKVYFVGLKGNGIYGDPTYDLAANEVIHYILPGLSFDYRTSNLKYISMDFCRTRPGGCNFPTANFNPRTGQNVGYGTHFPVGSAWGTGGYIVSRKGELYLLSRSYPAAMYKLNNSTLRWDKILGSVTPASGYTETCEDDTLATSCGVDLADAFVTENKTVYFVDRGGIIRVILPNGKVKTLFGQNMSFGDGGLPTSARLGSVNWMGVWGPDNKVVVADEAEYNVREFSNGVGATINKLCGKGYSGAPTFTSGEQISLELAVDKPCLYGYWGIPTLGMSVDRRNGEVYTSLYGSGSYGAPAKLLRSGPNTGRWQRFVAYGAGTYCMQNAESDNQLGNTVTSCSRTTGYGYPISIFGLLHPDTMTTDQNLGAVENGGSEAFVLMSSQVWTGAKLIEAYYKAARSTDGMIRHLSGTSGINSDYAWNFPAVGSNFSTSPAKPVYESYTEANYVQEDRSILFGIYNWHEIIRTPVTRTVGDAITGAGIISNKYSLPKANSSFTYRWSAGAISEIYYCSFDGSLNKYTVSSGVNTMCTLPLGSDNQAMFQCYGRSLHWDSTKTKLVFPVKQNGITAIAQYDVSGCN